MCDSDVGSSLLVFRYRWELRKKMKRCRINESQNKDRFWEVDCIRGSTIIFMIMYNYSFTLSYLNIYTVNGGFFYWYIFPRLIAATFILVSGLSLTLFHSRIQNKTESKTTICLRGLKIFSLGLLITIITFGTFPEEFIIFGILHLIGFSIIFGQFLLKYTRLTLFAGSLLIAIGGYLQNFRVGFPWLSWLGFIPKHFVTLDYFPVIPWFGVYLVGITLGTLLYPNGQRTWKITDYANSFIVKILSFLGKHSLLIYLLHQPLFILVLMMLGFKIF